MLIPYRGLVLYNQLLLPENQGNGERRWLIFKQLLLLILDIISLPFIVFIFVTLWRICALFEAIRELVASKTIIQESPKSPKSPRASQGTVVVNMPKNSQVDKEQQQEQKSQQQQQQEQEQSDENSK